MNEKAKVPASDLLDQALKNYEQALRTGIKIQEEAGAYWTKLFNQAASRPELQKQLTAMFGDVIPPTRKYLEGYLEVLEHNSRSSVELLKKGLDAAQTTNLADAQSKLFDFCEGSLKSLKANAQSVLDINSKAVDAWVDIARKSADVGELKTAKA